MKPAVDIVATMFLSRDQAHRAHLSTAKGLQHLWLDEFYKDIVDIADRFFETAQGIYGKLPAIPYKDPEKGSIDEVLECHLDCIDDLRVNFDKPCDGPLIAILDEAGERYAKTLNKLRNYQRL